MSAVLKKLVSPIVAFTRLEAAGGILLMFAAAVALIWANSPLQASYQALWEIPVSVKFGGFGLDKAFILWINDGLMALFFLLVGLEIKREVMGGELASPRKAALPLAAAVGGMVVPALFYVLMANDPASIAGWGIPMATDIAFALGILLLLGTRAPLALKIFLTAVAIVDDLGAVLVIAMFYTASINTTALMAAGVILALLIAANRLGVRTMIVYGLLGTALWFAVLKSGVHATIAGVLLALTIPMSSTSEDPKDSPLHHLEHSLHPWIVFVVMPVFALANAGVAFGGGAMTDIGRGVISGIWLGLVAGKPIGILLAAWLAVKSGVAELPKGINWRQMAGVASLCGIGFTMSLFIGGLAFADPALLDAAKLGILGASAISGVIGTILILTAKGAAATEVVAPK